jgi:beta-galactosidase
VLCAAAAAAVRPGVAAVRAGRTYPLNTGWLFGGGYRPGTEAAGFDDSRFDTVTVPHCPVRLPWGGWDPWPWEQQWIYRRHFLAEDVAGDRGARVFADFDGVMVNCAVLCNGHLVGQHQGGYLPFSVELTGQLTRGDNVLAVIVDSRCLPVPPMASTQPRSIDFMQPGGIYREVSLRVVPRVFLSDLFSLPLDVLSESPSVQVQCTVDGPCPGGTLLVELLSGDKRIAARTVPVAPGQDVVPVTLDGFGPARLWSVDSPVLYTVRATLRAGGISTLTRRIGFREASFRPDGFYLNGQRLQLFGVNRHQLFPYTGMAMPARVQRRDAAIIRNELNCNMVRCSHYPQSPAFLDACDELGLLVWEEAPGWDQVSSLEEWQVLVVQNVLDMVRRDRSRPSVIIWGTRLNETGDYPALWAATREAALELDPSRPTSGAMDHHSTDGWAQDVFAFNDYSVDILGDAFLQPPLPGVPYLVTESVGAMEGALPHFAWTDPPALLASQATLHAQAHSAAGSSAGYAGLLAWTAFDYASMRGEPDHLKWAGVADTFRVLKPGAAIYRAQVDPVVRPVIVPAFFWEPGFTGGVQLVASNCEELQVWVGGTPLGTFQPAAADPLYRNLPYPPFLVGLPPCMGPDLRIAGYLGGVPVAELLMSCDLRLDRLSLMADQGVLAADGSDMTRVMFRAVDAHGNQRRYPSGTVRLRVEGPGELIGDNPFPFGAYGGLGALWVRSRAGRPGLVTVHASHPELGQASVLVAVRAVPPEISGGVQAGRRRRRQ